jgi:enoyl-CoA hydratase
VDYETILYEAERGRARVTINRPEKLNALSGLCQRELNDAFWRADADPEVHCVILRGSGRSFCSGYDLTPTPGAPQTAAGLPEQHARRGRTMEDDAWRLEQGQRLRMAIWDMHKPVIAQVHGYCLAGGTDLALLCDIVVAAEDAVIGFPPVRAMGSPVAHMWTYLVGPQWAKYFLLTGDSVSGLEAERIGLVWRAVPADELEAQVERLADKMAMVDTDLLAANKRISQVALEMMGARTVQRMAAEMDARAHLAPAVAEFGRISREEGLKAALEWRDSRFGDSRTAEEYRRRREEQIRRQEGKA